MSAEEVDQLFDVIHSCKRGQREAIVGDIEDDDGFWKQLYVETREDEELRSFFLDEYEQDGRLLLITGSAGDGKSALLTRAYTDAEESGVEIPAERVNLDATASSKKTESYAERLDRFFANMVPDVESGEGHRAAVAINYGLAIDFFERRGFEEDYPDIWETLRQANERRETSQKNIQVLNLSHRRTFDSHPDRVGEGLLSDLFDQFAASRPDSPFHDFYVRELENCPAGPECPLRQNIEWLSDPDIRETLQKLVAAWSIVTGAYLNPRMILDIVATSLVPHPMERLADEDAHCKIGKAVKSGVSVPAEAYLWNSFFESLSRVDRKITSSLDPAAQETPETNRKVLEWSADIDKLRESLPVSDADALESEELVRTNIRADYLRNGATSETVVDWSWFREYCWGLTVLSGEGSDVSDNRAQDVYETIETALRGWTGRGRGTDRIEFADGNRSMEYRFYSEWETPTPDIEASKQKTREETIPGRFWMIMRVGGDQTVRIPLNFELYILLKRIVEGYTPNTTDLDRSESIRMIKENLSGMSKKQTLVDIVNKGESKRLQFEDSGFGITVDYEAKQ
jgi:DNA phosphorothioation-dependent restriction protein DptF